MQRYKILYSPFYFITLLSLTILLFLAGWVFASFFISGAFADHFREQVNIVAELPEDYPPERREALLRFLGEKSIVIKEDVRYIDSEQALDLMEEDLGASILAEGIDNPFREIVEFHLVAEALEPHTLQVLGAELKQDFGISGLYYPPDLFSGIQRTFRRIAVWGLVSVAVLLIIIMMLIHQIMKMNIISNRFLIRTMEMVGARPAFIRRPFISESVKLGLFASLLAILGFSLTLYLTRDVSGDWGFRIFSGPYFMITAGILICGVGICILSSRMAVNRYLGVSLDSLYA